MTRQPTRRGPSLLSPEPPGLPTSLRATFGILNGLAVGATLVVLLLWLAATRESGAPHDFSGIVFMGVGLLTLLGLALLTIAELRAMSRYRGHMWGAITAFAVLPLALLLVVGVLYLHGLNQVL